ncbi:imidazole glycerol phosphate synthase subunit HisH [Mucilaginibacter daejeonensis]|uniref:imidazole glycerol phosphate synthase subunit HisH n=1 Tax=Mucilaginibacter daejeonensis TaxID=398049 RepID=UPI001D176F09|nr:imidazole glycerol phosphate synthase subunit HisH [Mucilaginibacter daejeonensis]UEG51570.1 imidazole glycerol phosphate synthase subunit HisH [Mucilaginibacter daejeonensis]
MEELINDQDPESNARQDIQLPLQGAGGIGIVRYGAGNIFSLTSALDRLSIAYGMVHTEDDLKQFDRYIIPGVGHAGAAMQKLDSTGLVPAIKALNKPTLGICVGMQLMTAYSEEGDADLLNIFPNRTLKFKEAAGYKVPHTGWNRVHQEKEGPLFDGIPDNTHFYYVHSYYIEFDPTYTLASTDHSLKYSASIWRDNFYGVQFHPEKSGVHGERLLTNFSKL